jgi:hypothetical protein
VCFGIAELMHSSTPAMTIRLKDCMRDTGGLLTLVGIIEVGAQNSLVSVSPPPP